MATIPSIDAGESIAAAPAPPVRPCLDDIVTEDDTPVDSLFAEKQQRLLTEPLYTSWPGPGEGRPFLAAANVGVFYSPLFCEEGAACCPSMRRAGRNHVSASLFFLRTPAAQGVVQPGAGVAPAAVGGGQRDVEAIGRLLEGQAGEEAQRDDAGLDRIVLRDLAQRLVERQQLLGRSIGTDRVEVGVFTAFSGSTLCQ